MGRCDIIYKKWRGYLGIFAVVTFAVTWIEIIKVVAEAYPDLSRHFRGDVD